MTLNGEQSSKEPVNPKKNVLTTISGLLAAIGTALTSAGYTVGHIGSVDVVQAITAVSLLFLGFFAKDRVGQDK